MELQKLSIRQSRTYGAALMAFFVAVLSNPVAAQVYGDDVSVDSNADRSLLQPGQRDPNEPIHLHMPVNKHAATSQATEPDTADPDAAPEQPIILKKPHARKPQTSVASVKAKTKSTDDSLSYGWTTPAIPPAAAQQQRARAALETKRIQPAAQVSMKAPSRAERRKAVEAALMEPANAPAKTPTSVAKSPATGAKARAATRSNIGVEAPFSFESTDLTPPAIPAAHVAHAAPSATPRTLSQSNPPKQKHETPPPANAPTNLASAEPMAPHTEHQGKQRSGNGGSKQGEILFPGGAADPQAASFEAVRTIAVGLNSALDAGPARVEIDAYGGKPGDKSSDARRLSLRRALAIRQLLIDNGVPADRIDVRALGGAEDHGATDRVDVLLREG